jgi:hypothetical protein
LQNPPRLAAGRFTIENHSIDAYVSVESILSLT